MMNDTADYYRTPLTEGALRLINNGFCPDCHHRGFVLGPRGGAAINIECGNLSCRSRYNIAITLVSHHAVLGHRIARQDQGGSEWGLP